MMIIIIIIFDFFFLILMMIGAPILELHRDSTANPNINFANRLPYCLYVIIINRF